MKKRSQLLRLEALEDRTLLATCHVTRLSDTVIGNKRGAVGDLRYCINKVNAWPGPDVIDFTVTGTIRLNSALPNLTSDFQIQGPGAEQLTIDAQQKGRVFFVTSSANVEISGVTLMGGDSRYAWGGGVYNSGGLVLRDCMISRNIGYHFGGAIFNDGTLLISGCSIIGNRAEIFGSYYTWGGGIYNAAAGALLVHNSLVSNNSIEPSFSYVAIGGGIANLGNATVVRSTISDNEANPEFETTIGGDAGGIYNGGTLLVESSLITRNVASGDYWANGGGISNGYKNAPGGTVTVSNSTISDNVAWVTGYDDLFNPRGGGISSDFGGTINIYNSTIVGNQSESGLPGYGGGISVSASTQLHMRNTILAANDAANGTDLSGALSTSGFNLIQHSAGGNNYSTSDILDVNPMLGPLADNGGPTLTMALVPGSPAIDAGDNTNAPEFDQRGPGFPRIVNGTIDIGAFEVQSSPAPSAPELIVFLITAKPQTDE